MKKSEAGLIRTEWEKKLCLLLIVIANLFFIRSTQLGLVFGPPVTKDTMLKRSSENTVSAQFRTWGCWVLRANAHLCLATTSCFKTVRAGKLQLPLVSSLERTLNIGQFSSPQFFVFSTLEQKFFSFFLFLSFFNAFVPRLKNDYGRKSLNVSARLWGFFERRNEAEA